MNLNGKINAIDVFVKGFNKTMEYASITSMIACGG
jgi:hypothetical protein